MKTKTIESIPSAAQPASREVVMKASAAASPAPSVLRSRVVATDRLELQVREIAQHLSEIRRLEAMARDLLQEVMGRPSTAEDIQNDWIDAWAFVCLRMIEGDGVEFAHLEPSAYRHFEAVWLERVKGLKAYYIWKNRQTGDPTTNYFEASATIRQQLFNRRNVSAFEFERVKHYIEEQYLTASRNPVLADESKSAAFELVKRKAQRIYDTTRNEDSRVNWFRARLYTSMFYQNIVGAVLDHNEQKTRTILKAFEFSKAPENRYHIINGFETMVAINFLSPAIVREVLEHPELYDFSMEPVSDWPEAVALPVGLRFDRDDQQLVFEGVMAEGDRDSLLAQLTDQRHRAAVERLFIQTRLQPFKDQIL